VLLAPTPVHIAPLSPGDPLVSLPVPSVSGTPISVTVSGSTRTINPGLYSQITVSNGGTLTMNPGTYVIAGGGFSVTGSGSVSGGGVMIYNAGSGYNPATGADGGTFGSINLSGSGAVSLTPPSTGTYAGILFFQARDNTRTLGLTGNGIVMPPGGVVYAPAAALSMSSNGKLQGTLVVNTLNLSGNSVFNQLSGDGNTVYTPDQVRTAYGINNLTLDGTGQTVAIVDAYDDPAIYQALDAFDQQFGATASGPSLYQLYGPAATFLTVLNQRGQSDSLPAVDPTGPGVANWEMEEELDVQWAHALAPGAHIVLVESDSQSLADLMAGVVTAASQPGVSVVSMSWGFTEGQAALAQDEALYDHDLTTPAGHPGVTFVASTGDYGSANPEYPAFSPNVVAVGGTSLLLHADNSYDRETGWGYTAGGQAGTFIGSGGGVSLYEAEPSYQTHVQSTSYRTTPDVSLVADPNTGAWIADTYNLPADNPWEIVGGTSLSAPSWAGLIALANQARAQAGLPTFNSSSPTEVQQALYNVPAADFHDVTSGTNGYGAGVGYDLVTGLGTPRADLLIPDLVAYNGAVSSERTVTVTAAAVGGGSGASGVTNALRFNAVAVFNAEIVAVPGLGFGHSPVGVDVRAASVSERGGGARSLTVAAPKASAAEEDGLVLALTLSEEAPLTVQAGTPAEETPPTPLAAGPEAAPMGGAEFTGAGAENLARSFPEDPSRGLATLALSALPPASSGTAALLTGPAGSLQGPGNVLSWAMPDNGDSQEHQGSGGEILWAGLGDDIRIGATGRDFLLGGINSAAADPSDYARTHEAAALDVHEAALRFLVAEWSAAEGQETLARGGRTEDALLRDAEDTGALLAGGLFRWDGGPSQAAANGTALAGELGWGGEGS
jgi:hypothetical protein